MSEAEIDARVMTTGTLILAAVASALGMTWIGYLAWAALFALLSFARYTWQKKKP